MRLERYLIRHGKCDSLTEFLILKGYTDETVKSGLESFVSSWEESVKWIKTEYMPVSEEHYYELFHRTCLFLVLQHASPEQINPFLVRISLGDEIFKKNTMEVDTPCDPFTDDIGKIDKQMHWWLFRLPSKGGN